MLDKILDIISVFSPFILVSLLIFMSIFYQDLKALVMLFGLFMSIFILKEDLGVLVKQLTGLIILDIQNMVMFGLRK